MKPILKWVGGKGALIKQLKPLMPVSYNNYIEPFIGGGAVLLNLKPKKAYVNDYNDELINLYEMIKRKPDELIIDLKKHINEENYFYQIRSLDRDPKVYNQLTNVEKASRIVYLNKTSYNGLYRVNSRGELNVPFGRYKNPNFCDEKNIHELSEYFNKNDIKFSTGDFEKVLINIKEGDFVYIDSPYYPISETSSFTGYQANGFSTQDQKRLKKFCDKIDKKGAFFMASNSSCEFIKELYSDYCIDTIYARRSINSKASGRGAIEEVVITNYEEKIGNNEK